MERQYLLLEWEYLIIHNQMSQSLFGAPPEQPAEQIPSHTLKNTQFRQQIRRRHNRERFRAVRIELLHSLKSLEFLEDLKSEKDNFTGKKIKQLVTGLQMGLNNANFYQSIMDMQLDHYLCELFLHSDLELPERTKIIHTLVELTYFCDQSVKAVIDHHIIDHLMTSMKSFHMEDETEESFAYYAATLALNTSACFHKDLNFFIMESDFMKIMENLLEKSTRKQENLMYYRSDLRQVILNLYKNLFMDKVCQIDFAIKALFRLFNDHRNSQNQFVLTLLLEALSKAAAIPNLWRILEKQTLGNYGVLFQQIVDSFFTLKMLLLDGKQVTKGIQNFLDFMVTLYHQTADQQLVVDSILQLLNGGEIEIIIKQMHKKETGPSKIAICKMFQVLSYAFEKIQFNIFFPSQKSLCEFFQVLIHKSYITHLKYGKYALRILCKILKENKSSLDLMIDNGIYDAIRDVMDYEFLIDSKIEVIELVQCMADIEESIKPLEQKSNKLIEAFHERGIIKDIEKLQDHETKELSKRAVSFMKWVSELPSQIENSE